MRHAKCLNVTKTNNDVLSKTSPKHDRIVVAKWLVDRMNEQFARQWNLGEQLTHMRENIATSVGIYRRIRSSG